MLTLKCPPLAFQFQGGNQMVGGSILILCLYSFSWLSLTGRADVSHDTGLIMGTICCVVATYFLVHLVREWLILKAKKEGETPDKIIN